MRVVVTEAFKAYINMQSEDFTVGQKLKGDLAVRLMKSGAAVDPVDDDAHQLAKQLYGDGDQEQEGGGQQQNEPPYQPPAPGSNPDDGPAHPDPSQPAAPSHDAPVKDLLAWVGEDQARAQELLELEQAKDQPRSTLVKQLQKIAEQ